MKGSSKLQSALAFTKFSVLLLRCWPAAKNSSKTQAIIFELYWWFMFLSSLCLLFPLIASIYKYRDNSEIMTKSVCLSCAVSQCAVKMIFCRIRRTKLQYLLEELEDSITNPSNLDKRIFEKYVKKCTFLHIGIVIWVYFTSISFIILPFVIHQPFPTEAVYPFEINNIFLAICIYMHQSLVALQTAAAVLLDCLVAVLLWYICARFEILALSIGNFKNLQELKIHIKRYQDLLRYTNDVKNTINLFVFSTISTSVGGVLFSAIQLVTDQILTVKLQYAVVAVTATIGLFICSWAADTLLEVEYLVGIKAFQSDWIKMNKRLRTCILLVIAQSQNPVSIKANRILPTLSLAFFSQILLEDIDHFLKTAKDYERAFLEEYVNKNATLYFLVVLCCYGASIFVVCGPIFLPSPLPSEAKYPFSINSSPMWEIIYIHQVTAGFQASAGMCIDVLAAYILWFTGLRFELLYYKFKKIKSKNEMVQCIKEHQYLLSYGKELSQTFRLVIFSTVSCVTPGIAFGGIYLVSPQPIFVKGQFAVVCISAGINLYVTALPSDNLITTCTKIADVVYESLWIEKSSGIDKNWLLIIQRAQKPITIGIPGLIRELSLQYYFSVLCSTFSYFTALHVILTEEKEK